jgi:hypothetical protein
MNIFPLYRFRIFMTATLYSNLDTSFDPENNPLFQFFNMYGGFEKSLDELLVKLGEFIIESFLQYAYPSFPNTVGQLETNLHRNDSALITHLLDPNRSGDLGLSQLAGVTGVLAHGNSQVLAIPRTAEAVSSVHFQHILEVVSDNLDQFGLLSIEILQTFVDVLEDSKSLEDAKEEFLNLNLTARILHYFIKKHQEDFERVGIVIESVEELGIQECLYLIKLNPSIQEKFDLLLPRINEEDGETFEEHLIENLLYLNLVASKRAVDTLREICIRYSISDGVLLKLADGASLALIERYKSQIALKEKGGVGGFAEEEADELERNKIADILTNYTYQAEFFAFALEDPEFLEMLENADYENILLPAIHDAGYYIRLVNDIGALAELNEIDIGKEFNHIWECAGEIGYDASLSNKQNLLRLIDNCGDAELQRRFFTITKDIRQNEGNMALDFAGCETCEFDKYLEKLKERVVYLSKQARNAKRKILLSPENGGYDLVDIIRKKIFLFMEYCREMYAKKIDYDSNGSFGIYSLDVIKDPDRIYEKAVVKAMAEEDRKSNKEL